MKSLLLALAIASQWEIFGTIQQNTVEENWADSYGMAVALNLDWSAVGLRVGGLLEEEGRLTGELGLTIAPRSRTFGQVSIGQHRSYRAGIYRKLFNWDDTSFTVGGGLLLRDNSGPVSDLQPWISVGWLGQ